jgi:hypothetical protein
MITFDELAALWLRQVVPKEAERGAIGLQMVASFSQKRRVYTVVWRRICSGVTRGRACRGSYSSSEPGSSGSGSSGVGAGQWAPAASRRQTRSSCSSAFASFDIVFSIVG